MTPSEDSFSLHGILEFPGCWETPMRKQEGKRHCYRPLTSDNVYPKYCYYSTKIVGNSNLISAGLGSRNFMEPNFCC